MKPDSRISRIVQWIAATRLFARIAPHIVPPLDRLVHRLTRGRVLLGQMIVPSLLLTSIGAKSGEPRESPLACFPEGDGFYVVGSNFGRDSNPAWTANLLANPEATVSFRNQETKVRATLLQGEERAAAWAKVTKAWPPYHQYAARVSRELRVFRLDPI